MNQQLTRDNHQRKKHGKTDPNFTVSVIPVEEPAADEDPNIDDPQTVSVTSCLVVMSSFVIGGAILFSVWEVAVFLHPSIFIDFFFILNGIFQRAGAMWMDPIFVSQVY
jgi:hypothetical protein